MYIFMLLVKLIVNHSNSVRKADITFFPVICDGNVDNKPGFLTNQDGRSFLAGLQF